MGKQGASEGGGGANVSGTVASLTGYCRQIIARRLSVRNIVARGDWRSNYGTLVGRNARDRPRVTGMAINADKPHLWKADIAQSVDHYNSWFLRFAPEAYRFTRSETIESVAQAFQLSNNLTDISPVVLRQHPSILPILRMTTAPPLARDRLIGLAGVSPGLVQSMEVGKRVPQRALAAQIDDDLERIGQIIMRLMDEDLFPWLRPGRAPTAAEIYRAATVVADRLCGAIADPIIRNAQEQRQLVAMRKWGKGACMGSA